MTFKTLSLSEANWVDCARVPAVVLFKLCPRAREAKGMKLSDLGVKSGAGKGIISRLETTPNANPEWHTIQAIAKGLGLTPKELISK